jgi:hypothetical protein
VPFLPQSEALCGGAALAMVLRYWGEPGVQPEDFAAAVLPDGTGIPAESLGRLAESRGYRAFAFTGGADTIRPHLRKGRPLIALAAVGKGRHHFVVVLAWENGRVLVHDPAIGPFRVIDEKDWSRRTRAAGGWTLLVAPAEDRPPRPPTDAPADQPGDACEPLLRPAVSAARAGDLESARAQLEALTAWCPRASSPLRELAALAFRQERWSAAESHAAEAVSRDPRDVFAWKLLATSRFLGGRREAALAAWNAVDEPALDLVQIGGTERTPFRVVYDHVGEAPGRLLTPERFRRAVRRVEAVPAFQLSRVSYRPLAGGKAQLDVDVVERSALSSPRQVALRSAVLAASEQALGLDVSALARSGESFRLAGQWQRRRARALVSGAAVGFLGLPGITTVEALWDEQSYRLAAPEPPFRERRLRAAVSTSHWWTADARLLGGAAVDEWRGRGRHVSLFGELEQRFLSDRLSIGGRLAGWWGGRGPFQAGGVRWVARTTASREAAVLGVDVSYEGASGRAPLALWPGAGTGAGRARFLRAHPLVRDGIVDGAAFGRAMLTGTLEGEAPIGAVGPLRLRAAAFIDRARVLAPRRGPVLTDLGVGLRVRPPASRSEIRADVATPWGDGGVRVSAGWVARWP